MKVALVAAKNSGHRYRGIGFYTERLFKALKELSGKDFSVELLDKIPEGNDFSLLHFTGFEPFSLNLPVRTPRQKAGLLYQKSETPYRKPQVAIHPHLDKAGLSGTGVRTDVPYIVTVHDLIPLVFPEYYPAGIKGRIKWEIQKRLLKNAKAIITDSQCSKDDIIRLADIRKDAINVTYLAADKIFRPIKDKTVLTAIALKYRLPGNFILYVGDINWNKNIITLIRASKKINTPLVIVGKQALEIDNLSAARLSFFHPRDLLRKITNKPHPHLVHLEELKKEWQSVIRLGFVPDEDLAGIYSLATVYCQPSFYEGFGLPVLEAMACGCPVVSSFAGSLREIGGEAAVYFDPYKAEDLVKNLKYVLSLETAKRQELTDKGFRQAIKFSWSLCAERTRSVYRKIMENP
ncbi:MAG: glycosyltransferase family 1 protein [bacterium]|nr:glycosyltransferase family 1 protein [bacterium]